MRNIALIGKMGSGKDTAANVLIRSHHYRPYAFATPLKAMVIEADPIVSYTPAGFGPLPVRLSDLLSAGHTFEEIKREFPEVRRSLQRIGQSVRKIDPEYWVEYLKQAILSDYINAVPIVVTDVRYTNEADALGKLGFTLVRIKRGGLTTNGYTTDETRAMLHPSETELDSYPVHHTIRNDGSVLDLASAVLDLV
jgi:hypothetical protein